MNAYEKIYQALTQGRDEKWKKTVDETVKRFKSQGMTDLMAMKHTAMELNTERTNVSVSGVFLKAYHTRAGESLFNILDTTNSETVMVSGETNLTFPEHPSVIEIKKGEKVRNLMTKKTNIQIGENTTVEFGGPANPELILESAREIMDVPGEEYALIKGRVISLATFKPKDQPDFEGIMVTPENTNLMLTIRSGTEWPKVFVRNLELLMNILPSPEDCAKFQEFCDNQEWDRMVAYFNEVCADNRDFSIEGLTVVAYGKVTDRTYEDKKTGEERQSKNFNVSVGGFIYSIDLLSALLAPKSPPKKETKEKAEEFKFDFGTANTEPEPEKEADEKEDDETPTPSAADVDAPEDQSVEEMVLELLEKAKNGMVPAELLKSVKGVTAEDLATKLTSLHKAGKVQLKDGKFHLKRKK